jgi:hypothetical protein
VIFGRYRKLEARVAELENAPFHDARDRQAYREATERWNEMLEDYVAKYDAKALTDATMATARAETLTKRLDALVRSLNMRLGYDIEEAPQ